MSELINIAPIKVSELINIAPGKRIVALKKLKAEQKNVMRARLPVLTREDILRYRLPPHVGLIRAIDLDGFKSTAEYIKQLIEYQEHVRNIHGPDTHVWSKPRLIYNMDILQQLKEGLYKAEKAHLADNISVEIAELLKLAVVFAFGEENWWWLGHQLLEQALTISKDYMGDGGMHHAIARYALGKFFMETNVEAALEHLNIARSMSIGTSWSARGIFLTYQNIIFAEVSILLHVVMLRKAKNCMKTDPHLAIRLCILAEKAALDGCHYSGQTEAQIIKGECEQMIHDTHSAIISFRKALVIQNAHEEPKWKAEALSHLAIAYLKHGDLTSALQKLHELKDYAFEHQLVYYVAQAYKYLGEYYLREGTPQNATPLLRKALKLFHEGQHIHEAESTRNYAAISIGIELMNPYIQLIVGCVDTNCEYEFLMKKLIAWKDSRTNFWRDEKVDVSFIDLYDTMDKSEDDLLKYPQSDDPMFNQEVVLSILSLVDSTESFRAQTSRMRDKSDECKEDLQELNEEKLEEDITNEQKIEINEEDSTEEHHKNLVILHFTEDFKTD